ncbi:MAG: hypothetical protein KF861_03305 [Planctomycetaceae bacterium]|nr:hypothetical protein [Planctomycetaceae bacterium]
MPESATCLPDIAPVTAHFELDQPTERAPSEQAVSSQFAACKIGGMLLLKLIGFIEDERAEILEISEEHVVLRLGRPWYSRWWNGDERRRPVSVRLDFAEPGNDLPTWQRATARRSLVKVNIRPMTTTFRNQDFQRRAQSVLRSLKLHFVAD